MADVQKGQVGVVYPYGDADQSPARAHHINRATMLYLENDTGGELDTGDVVFLDTDGKVSVTTVQGKAALILVVALNEDSSSQAIANGAEGWFQVAQYCPQVSVDGATSIGDWLITSTTQKKATPNSDSEPPVGAFGIAVSSDASTVAAVLLPGFGWGYASHKDASANVHGLGSGVHVVGTNEGDGKRIEFGSHNFGSLSSGCGTQSVTFGTAFGSAPVVLTGADFGRDAAADHECFVEADSVSTTGFTFRACNNSGTGSAITGYWMAIGE